MSSKTLHILMDGGPDHNYSPEQNLLLSILGRSIYDLRPEAPYEMRRTAIAWFRDVSKDAEKHIASFVSIKNELDLGFRFLSLIQQALQEAIAYENYRVETIRTDARPDVKAWMSTRKSIINTTTRSIHPRVRTKRRL